MSTDQFARCPKCNVKVRVTQRRWDVKLQAYVQQPAYGSHPPHGNAYDPARCEMSGKLFRGELITT